MMPRLLRRRSSPVRAPGRGRPALEILEARNLPSTLTVLNLNDNGAGSLRQAILKASAGDTINFAVSGTITLTSGPLAVNQDLTIAGPGAGALTISGNNADRVVVAGDVNLNISGMTLAKGIATTPLPNIGLSGGALTLSGDPSKTLSLTDCVFTNNASTAGNGGAIELFGDGAMNVTDCLFANNSTPGNGGAIDSPGINLNVRGSTFASNTAGNGGAISIGNDSVSIIDSTFFNNSASGQAGAIFSDFNADYALTNCTVADNSAPTGGGFSIIGGSLTLRNTIVADNSAPTGPDISGAVNSLGNNLIGETDGSFGYVASDKTGTAAKPLSPGLGAFANYGGPTPVLPLLQGSPALDAGSTTGAPTTDQRGDQRGSLVDIGAAQLLQAVVTTTADSGPGSLRQAILDTNAHPGNDFIAFDVPGGGVHTIHLASALPDVTGTVVIDGYTQPGSSPNTLPAADNAVIDVVVDGGGMNADGIVLNNAANCVVRGLSIVGFGSSGAADFGGIAILGQPADDSVIGGNFLGVLPNGVTADANSDGIIISGNPDGNVVGGTDPADRNLISGNVNWGFILEGDANTIEGNLIGLDSSGLNALGNGNGGVIDQLSLGNVIGGTAAAARNYIAGNVNRGLKLTIDHTSDAITSGPSPSNTLIEGNWIGVNIAGAGAGSQNVAGVEVRNASTNSIGGPGAGNVISGNTGEGVIVFGSGAGGDTVAGNFIGTDPTGTTAVPNGGDGVSIGGGAVGTTVGGTAAGDGNVISGNGGDGVIVQFAAGATFIEGNLIGLNAAGTGAVGNGVHGVQVFTSAFVAIGGDTPAARNVISGNGVHGVALNGSGTTIVGNYIGTNAAGTAAIGNGRSGIGLNAASGNTIGDTTGGGNVISGNAASGVEFFNGSNANTVIGNLIGTAADGVSPLGNGQNGARFIFTPETALSIDNRIGSLAANGGNVIAFNPAGVVVDLGTGNTISGNSIFANPGGGIFLGNFLAVGANDSLPAPVLTGVGVSSVGFTLNVVAGVSYRVEFFTSPAGSPNGQGKTLLGSTIVSSPVSGVVAFNAATPGIAPGLLVSATATALTDPLAGDTSEFSAYMAAPLPLVSFRITPSFSFVTAGQAVSYTVTALDGNDVVLSSYQGTITFSTAGTDAAPLLPAQYAFTAADAGSHTFSATYFIAGTQTLTATDILNLASGSTRVNVSAGAFDHLTIGGLSAATPVGVQNLVTVMAVDQFGNVVSGFNDTVSFGSNDLLAQLPASATLTNGVGTFPVTFRGLLPTSTVNGQTVREYKVTVTDARHTAKFATQAIDLPLYLLPSPVQFLEVENTPFTDQLVATFLSDLAPPLLTSLSTTGFSATIDWGDGSRLDTAVIRLLPDGVTFAVYGSHTYPTGQTDYPVDVTVSFAGFSSQPVTPSVAAVLTESQFANVLDASVVRAVGNQSSLTANTSSADAVLDGASAALNSTVFVADYAHNPEIGASVDGVSFYDIRATNPTDGARLVVTFRFPDRGGVPQLEFFDPNQGKYVAVSVTALGPSVPAGAGMLSITVVFDASSFPSLSDLHGSVFTIVLAPAPTTVQTTISPALAIADRPTSDLTVTRSVAFQGSGLALGLTPSQDVTLSAGRADLSGGGGDDLDYADPADLDAIFGALGFGPDERGGAPAPVASPAVLPPSVPGAAAPKTATPGASGAGVTGPGAALPQVITADALFAAAADAPFPFAPPPAAEPTLPAGSPRQAAAPSLLAVPLAAALAPRQVRKRRRAGAVRSS
jgi:predicted outer membrane repeat protein